METILYLTHTQADGSLSKGALEALTGAVQLARSLEGSTLNVALIGAWNRAQAHFDAVKGENVVDYTEPEGKEAGRDFTRVLDSGTFALQAHDPESTVSYRKIKVRRLP